jgi:cytochrome P450/ferredoxin-NADP reductase
MTTDVPPTADPAAARCPFSNPHEIFGDLAAARAQPGLSWNEHMQRHVVSRYDDVVQALHDPDLFSSQPVVPVLPSPWREMFAGKVPDRGTLIGHDNPTHDRLRAAVNTFFMPRKLARFEPWMDQAAHRQVDTFVARGTADLKVEFGLPLALKAIAHIVGLDVDRSEWIGLALSFFLGPRDVHYPVPPQEKARALLELHEWVLQVMHERRTDRRDDLISHVWNVRDSGEVDLTDFEMLSLFPGLMLAGHETSSNLICMGTAHLLSQPGAWEAAQHDDASRARALEELLRYESAITGMPRLVTRDTALGGTPLRTGEHVFLAHASGSRDSDYFDSPDELRPDRRFDKPHLGLGQGVHACLGAPLARLLLRTELRVLHERLPGLRLDWPYGELEYGPVGEGRGVAAHPIAWDPVAAATPRKSAVVKAAGPVRAVMVDKTVVAEGVTQLEFEPVDSDFPTWQPGAHIDVHVAEGLTRQYSLCGEPADHRRWRIAVRLEPDGRGGSRFAHERLTVGGQVLLTGPRNNFGLDHATEYLFVAGGIGITPLLPMIAQVDRARTPWRLIYLGRRDETMPYLDELRAAYGDAVTVWISSRQGRLDLPDLFGQAGPGTAVYCCGPELLLEAIETAGGAGRAEGPCGAIRTAPAG